MNSRDTHTDEARESMKDGSQNQRKKPVSKISKIDALSAMASEQEEGALSAKPEGRKSQIWNFKARAPPRKKAETLTADVHTGVPLSSFKNTLHREHSYTVSDSNTDSLVPPL